MRKIIVDLQVSLDGVRSAAERGADLGGSWKIFSRSSGMLNASTSAARMVPGYEEDLAGGAGNPRKVSRRRPAGLRPKAEIETAEVRRRRPHRRRCSSMLETVLVEQMKNRS